MSGNPTLSLNVTFLLSIVLTAWTLHLVVHRWTGSHAAGAVAACSYLLTGWVLWEWLPTTPHWAVLQYLPLIIFLAATPATDVKRQPAAAGARRRAMPDRRDVRRPRRPRAARLLGLTRLARRPTRTAGAALLGIVALTAVAMAVPIRGHLRVRATNPNMDRQTYWRSDPDFFRQFGTPLPWGLFYRNAPTALPGAALLVIGAGALSFALHRSSRRQAWAIAALWTAVGTYLSLTPSVRWGDHPVDLPQAWLAEWLADLSGHPRAFAPRRDGSGRSVAACRPRLRGVRPPPFEPPLASFPGAERRARRRADRDDVLPVSGPPAGRVDGGPLGPPYPVAAAIGSESPFLSILRQSGGPLLEFPPQLSPPERAPVWHARAMYRSIFHGRKILNGYASYFPAGFIERMGVAAHLPDAAAIAQLKQEAGLELVWVHGDYLSATARGRWIGFFEQGGRSDMRPKAREGNDLLFDVS